MSNSDPPSIPAPKIPGPEKGVLRRPAGPIQVLVVEDNPADARLLGGFLDDAGQGFQRAEVTCLSDALAFLAEAHHDIILLDLGLPDSNGVETARRIHRAAPDTPVVVLTGRDDEETAIAAVKEWAQDYLVKGKIDGKRLLQSIVHSIERYRLTVDLLDKVRASELNFQYIVSTSADGVVVTDEAGVVQFANPAATRLLGRDAARLQGERLGIPLAPDLKEEISTAEGRILEVRMVRTRWGDEPAFLITLVDVTDRKRAEDEMRRLNESLEVAVLKLERLAEVDPLTQVLNRRGLDAKILEMRKLPRTGESVVAILIDCDDFKGVNDRWGHAAGDEVLKTVAREIRAALRPSDHVGRIGGDEFLVLLPETRFAEGLQVAQRLRLAVAGGRARLCEREMGVTASLGVATVPSRAISLEEILAILHAALRRSKKGGKNRVSSSRPEGIEPLRADDLGGLALGEGCFRALTHAIRRLDDDRVVGYELLSRGPTGLLERPVDFFRFSMENDILTSVDLHCLKACLAAASGIPAGTRIHLNIFPSTLVRTPTDQLLSMFPTDRGGGAFCLEMSEQHMIGDPAELTEPVEALRAAGILIAIDDLGFGRSSLETLVLLEPDIVKVDPTCFRGAAQSRGIRSLGRLLRITQALSVEVVAEGIETPEERTLLQQMGVPLGQGFLWGPPTEPSQA